MPPRPATEPEPQWPPRSPHEALLSTPGGRERLRRLAEQTSPSPSPSKRATSRARGGFSNARKLEFDNDAMDLNFEGDEDEDEDEEMLELKLAAIQARLKLKRLQSARAKKAQDSEPHAAQPESTSTQDARPTSRVQSRAGLSSTGPEIQPQSHLVDVQVPASPVRRAALSQDLSLSPSRVRLGIDKGLRAKDVSLKRAPDVKKTLNATGASSAGYIRRTNTPAPGSTVQQNASERPKTFSERLAAARLEEVSRQERQERVKQARSQAFQLGQQEMEDLKRNAVEIPDIPEKEEEFSRDEVMAGRGLRRRNTVPNSTQQGHEDGRPASSHEAMGENPQKRTYTRKVKVLPSDVPEEEASAFEPYSSVHLSKRIIPHLTLTRNLAGKKTYVLPDLLKHVKAPDFQLPDIEQDIVVFAILASKSEPRVHKNTNSNLREKTEVEPARAKYMVLKLVDLKWELELFLFNTGFERYWKLTPGTLIAILNPTIMPPPPERTDTGRFSLVINSGQDTILEVGTARDLGFCKSVKKDGALCNSWVNAKRTEFCEFHMNLALSKKRLARQDVNAFDTGLGPKRRTNSYRLTEWEQHERDPNRKKRGNYDRETQSTWFMRKSTPAQMIDNEVLGGDFTSTASTIERSEALRRRLATEEKERDLMKKLGQVGSGAGKEYMLSGQQGRNNKQNIAGGPVPAVGSSSFTSEEDPRPPRLDAKSLGLILDKGSASNKKIHLSPVKRKRVESALSSRSSSVLGPTSTTTSSSSSSGKMALGWGGGLKDKLARMKEGEKLDVPSSSTSTTTTGGATSPDRPARKKTRFITEKGIREAGRESLGDELTGGVGGIGGSGSNGGGSSSKGDSATSTSKGGMVYLHDFDDDDDDDDELVILR
ncbi:hypothetical protein F5Y17DRAFT_383915 [Xylariaceae sp. FL0594]|nr:hypothetical protein F5Y17DRAFT_383915 [Xylariaceae sp. FL0594]